MFFTCIYNFWLGNKEYVHSIFRLWFKEGTNCNDQSGLNKPLWKKTQIIAPKQMFTGAPEENNRFLTGQLRC